MKNFVVTGCAVIAVLFASKTVHAQDAVQWTEAEGGNGHWYERVAKDTSIDSFEAALAAARSRGGDLCSVNSLSENEFCSQLAQASIGNGVALGTRVNNAKCPSGFEWTDGSPWDYENWGTNQPECVVNQVIGYWNTGWHDLNELDVAAYLFEWSADCNEDGIVDYGQILDGTFIDEDGNGVPDCCDDTTCLAPVQWRTEDGGNGHWYQLLVLDEFTYEPGLFSSPRGAHAATLVNSDESDWVFEHVASNTSGWININGALVGPRIGLGNPCDGAWYWLTGEPFSWSNWAAGEPSSGCDGVVLYAPEAESGPQSTWAMFESVSQDGFRAIVLEWSADCNGDGLVDYGQIASGELADADDSGIPDICEAPVQWETAAGGNGHWYQYNTTVHQQRDAARNDALAIGGDLVSITSPEEDAFVDQVIDTLKFSHSFDLFTGGYNAGGSWAWTTGEAWTFADWHSTQGNAPYVEIVGRVSAPSQYQRWGTAEDGGNMTSMIEWEADCNGDGIVDYGQILDGTFIDEDGNGVPDCCDTSTCLDAIQWKVADGGNGHWYSIRFSNDAQCWDEARQDALALGGGLVSMESPAEFEFCADRVDTIPDEDPDTGMTVFVGLEQPNDASEPGGDWVWLSGVPLDYNPWGGTLDDAFGCQDNAGFRNYDRALDDIYPCLEDGCNQSTYSKYSIIEFSADCNNDGIVDYGQILDGTFADCDGDGVPDTCDLNATFAASEPRTPEGAADFIEFDVSSMPNASDTVTVELSANGDLATTGEFMFVYLDGQSFGLAFVADGAACETVSTSIEIPAATWNSAGLDGTRVVRISGNGIDPDTCENPFTAINVTYPIVFDDCNTNGLWDACEIAEGSVTDSDEDGVMDECDGCVDDPNKTEPGTCGCGAPDEGDADQDGILDCVDDCPNWPYECSEDGQTITVAEGQSIQQAIDVVPAGGTVEIAAGTFTPVTSINTNGKAMTIRGAIDEDGNPTTILDGQSSMRLITCTSGEGIETQFKNLLITNGSVSGPSAPGYRGGGMYCEGSSPELTNCIFRSNTSSNDGGGMACYESSSPTLTNCVFELNTAAYGGGMANSGNSSPTLDNCILKNNSADITGGGIYNETNSSPFLNECTFRENSSIDGAALRNSFDCSPTILSCLFIENAASDDGGGIYNWSSSNPSFDKCTFQNNSAPWGGAIHNGPGCTPTFNNSAFENNSANNYGGAVYCNTGANASFTTCVFTGNSASNRGGAIFFDGSSGVVTNCQFNGNYTTEEGSQGGAVYNSECTPSFINCDFTGNSAVFGSGMYNTVASTTLEGCVFNDNNASEETGAVHNYSESNATFESCVFINNSTTANIGGGIYNQTSTSTVSNSILCGNTPNQIFGSYTDGGENCFTDICDSDGDETLDCNDGCPEDPNKTEPGQCDCGVEDTDTDEDGIADCNDPCPNWPYDCSEDGQTITVAVGQSIQDGLAATPVGGNLILAAGVHDLSGTLQISGNLNVSGEVDGDGNPTTILNGELFTGPAFNSVLNSEDTLNIRDLVIRDCTVGTNDLGGALKLTGGTVIVENVWFNANEAGQGGAVWCGTDSSVAFIDCEFTGNSATASVARGGAVLVSTNNLVSFTECAFVSNISDDDGAGIYFSSDGSTEHLVTDCFFDGNFASFDGGGIRAIGDSRVAIDGTLFTLNFSSRGTGVQLQGNSEAVITNSVFTGNQGDPIDGTGNRLAISSTVICGNDESNDPPSGYEDLGANCFLEECGDDLDDNGVPDACDPDCNSNGLPDGLDPDCDENGTPDECDITDGNVEDCNGNGVPDSCDITEGIEEDDNANGIPDSCDIARGDLNSDGCVDAADIGTMLALWGIVNPPLGDLNGDGIVGAADLGILLSNWDTCP